MCALPISVAALRALTYVPRLRSRVALDRIASPPRAVAPSRARSTSRASDRSAPRVARRAAVRARRSNPREVFDGAVWSVCFINESRRSGPCVSLMSLTVLVRVFHY